MEKIAKVVISSKVNGVTSNIQKGLGLDDDSGAERVHCYTLWSANNDPFTVLEAMEKVNISSQKLRSLEV